MPQPVQQVLRRRQDAWTTPSERADGRRADGTPTTLSPGLTDGDGKIVRRRSPFTKRTLSGTFNWPSKRVDSPMLAALHGFIKKTQKTPDADLALARKRQKDLES